MAKEKEKKTERKPTASRPSLWQRTLTLLRSEQARFVCGLIILMLSAIVGLAFISFLSTGKADQAMLEHLSLGRLSKIGNGIHNWMGTFGAIVAEVCINRWIGVAAFLFVVYFLRLGFRLVKGDSVRGMFLSFILTSLWAVWTSMALGFFFVRFYEDTFLYLGGRHGYDFTRLMAANIGWAGTAILLVVLFLLLSLAVWKSTISKTRAVLDAPSQWNERRKQREAEREAAAAEAETNAGLAAEPVADLSGTPETFATPQPTFPDLVTDVPPADEPPTAGDALDEEPLDPWPPTPEPADDDEDVAPLPVQVDLDPATDDAPDEPAFTVQAGVTETVDAPVELPQDDYDPTAELSDYQFPGFDLLKHYDNTEIPVDMAEQNANKEKIKQTLLDYGIEIQDIKATVGPTITLFEIVLKTGTKINRVKSLSDEIAMSIASTSGIRIIAPIPGKSAIGIEVPNKDPQTVSMRECIQSRAFQEAHMELPVALGKTITNEVFVFDLAKAPHLLVAGATGQGKSVGLNAIITSLLYKKHPSQLKMVLVDPKQVEFGIYERIERHYLAKLPDEEEPIITDVSKVVATLNSVCLEMEDRYALLKDVGLRNIKEYNEKFIHRHINPTKHIKAPNGSKEGANHHYLPYIVVVVDEYGDLIMTAGKEIELPIARIAQKARAVGIHMIIATQRPSAKIITGIIKANFPARIAFRVGQAIDSSIILDQTGAQKLIGRGDLLISTGNRFERVQCAFVDTPEVDRINRFIASQQAYPTAFILPEPPAGEGGDDGGQGGDVDLHQLDPMFGEAAEMVVATGQGSTSMIQRKFSIGYNRAGRIMDQLEAAGIVGPYTGSKARAVLIDSEMELQNILQGLNNG